MVFHSCGDGTPFRHLADLPTAHRALTRDTLRAALLASGSIPLLLEGVRIPEEPGGADDAAPGGPASRVYWDGGVLDYHLDLDFGAGAGLVLYPHFYAHVVPGWFDKALRWRRAGAANFRRALLVAPSDAFVASLPGGRIPERRDFYELPESERMRRWQAVVDASARLGDELRELLATGRLVDRVEPWR